MISNINGDKKEINDKTILDLFYESQVDNNMINLESLIKKENIDTVKQLVTNDSLLLALNNNHLIILFNILSSDKDSDQNSYIKKIIDKADDELILQIAKNKSAYHSLNRENKNIIKSKLNRSPWISVNEIIPL